MVSTNAEEKSGINDENYIVVGEEHVVDGVANFMARCIVASPEALNLTPQELQKALTKALGGINKVEKTRNVWHAGKMFYTMAIWGLTPARYILNILNRVAQILTSSSFLHLVPKLGYLETCCSWGLSFEQTGLESTFKRARQSSFFKQ